MSNVANDETPAPEPRKKTPFEEFALLARRAIKPIAEHVRELAELTKTATPSTPAHDRGEMIANLMLAYRHLEDASMRLGKAIQAADGGVSVYDRETTVGA